VIRNDNYYCTHVSDGGPMPVSESDSDILQLRRVIRGSLKTEKKRTTRSSINKMFGWWWKYYVKHVHYTMISCNDRLVEQTNTVDSDIVQYAQIVTFSCRRHSPLEFLAAKKYNIPMLLDYYSIVYEWKTKKKPSQQKDYCELLV